MELLSGKLKTLIKENKNLKDLIRLTEIEMEAIIKKTQDESNKVKSVLHGFYNTQFKENESPAERGESLACLSKILDCEEEVTRIKECILDLAAENSAKTKKVARWEKKIKALEQAKNGNLERIDKLTKEKVVCISLLNEKKELKKVLIDEARYLIRLNKTKGDVFIKNFELK